MSEVASTRQLTSCHVGDLSPIISIEKLDSDTTHVEQRISDYKSLLLGAFDNSSSKRHRFSVVNPIKTEKHHFTAANTVLCGKESETALADFRSRGSYACLDQNPRVTSDVVESAEIMASNYNANFDKIYEYSLVYSSYCLGRDDTLLCSEPSPVPLVPYSTQDISLKQFIVQLGHGDLCPHCALPNRLHIRRMVYASRALHVMFITSRAKLEDGEFITWSDSQPRPTRVSSLFASMSVASFLRLLLAPGSEDSEKRTILRSNHYFAIGHIICAIKPFSLLTKTVQLPSKQLTPNEECLWSLEPCGIELEELSKQGYSLLDEIEQSEQSELFNQSKAKFSECFDNLLVEYGQIRNMEKVKWSVLCQMYNQLGHLGLVITKINDKWLENQRLVLEKDDVQSEADSELPEIISTPLNYVNNLLNANKLTHKRHFLSSESELAFPIREDEPTSIYAFALSNPTQLKPDDSSMVLMLDNFLTCKIYHFEAFSRFRQYIGITNDFIASIMRCSKWEAKGGKSGASFYKSHDQKYVVKHIGVKEVKTIVEKGGLYVEYMMGDRPSCLAKIFGVFQIQMKHKEALPKSHYLIMEDIFFGKKITKTYDLKGSRRNRMSKEEHIFLDSNYINHMRDYPVYIDKASQLVLHGAIHNDADFLSSHSIIDYSLLVGVDEESDKLYIGIIDFIRTYTWDKKVEYEIKTHFTPGSTPPTILHPLKYKERFIESIKKYFNHSPNYYDRTLSLKMPT